MRQGARSRPRRADHVGGEGGSPQRPEDVPDRCRVPPSSVLCGGNAAFVQARGNSEGDVGPRPVELDRRLWSAMSVRKVAVVASASGNGKTTLGRELAQRLRVPFIELDSLVHGPGWVEISDEDLRARVEPIVISDGWVIDGAYQHKLGDLVLNSADLVVWLDLPIRTWLPRLIRRTGRRLRTREQLWNGNTESLASAMWGRESLLAWALRSHFRRRREWPDAFATRPVVRLTTPSEVDRFLAEARSLSPPN